MKNCRLALICMTAILFSASLGGIAISQVSLNPQQTAEKFAPLLRFDQKQGDTDKCFPSSPAEYYEQRIVGGNTARICNRNYTSIQSGQIPIYYQHEMCYISTPTSTSGEVGSKCVTLLAGKSVDVGTVCVHDVDLAGKGTITYTLKEGWELTEADVWFGTTLADLPKTQNGNPKIGHFPYRSGDIAGETSYSFEVAEWPACRTAYVAAHANVRGAKGEAKHQIDTAWGMGPKIADEGNWATFFILEPGDVQQDCPPQLIPVEMLVYWFFYGYQDHCDCCSGDHPADWEHVTVKIVNGQLDRVMFYQHDGNYAKVPGHYEVHEGTHPIVYVGKNNHGSYHDDGGSGTCCYYEDWRNPGTADKKMMTWLNLKPIDRLEPWMNYDGYWNLDNNEVKGPLFRDKDQDLCALQGCRGAWAHVCWTSGCTKSDIGDDIL